MIKHLSLQVFLGVVLALPVIYLLRPLNSGAIALVLFLTTGIVVTVGALLRALRRKEGPK